LTQKEITDESSEMYKARDEAIQKNPDLAKELNKKEIR
jgi:hypothetical protein